MSKIRLNFLYKSKISLYNLNNGLKFKLFNLNNLFIYLFMFYYIFKMNKLLFKINLFIFNKNTKTITYLRSPNNNKLAQVKLANINYKFIISLIVNNFVLLSFFKNLLFFDSNLFYNYKINYYFYCIILFLYCCLFRF